MANIVPRTNIGASLGTTAKKWLKGWFQDIFFSGVMTDGTNSMSLASLVASLGTIQEWDEQIYSDVSTVGTTSTSFIDIPSCSFTTAGTKTKSYIIKFTANATNSNNGKITSVGIMVDGVDIPATSMARVHSTSTLYDQIFTMWQVSLAPGKVVKARYKASANTSSMTEKVFIIRGRG